MTGFVSLFWFSTLCIAYTYIGYPLLLLAMSAAHQLRSDLRQMSGRESRRVEGSGQLPTVAVVVAAYNEERHIAERIRNLLAQDYPADRLRVYIGSDASNDSSAEIVRQLASARVTFVDFAERRGKSSVVNDVVAMAKEDILVLTDANTHFQPDVVQKLVRHFDQPEVGCVCGELRLVNDAAAGENQDHIYWRYERMLKFFESRIGALLGANGGVYALRRRDYAPIPPNTIVDDFWISMQVVEAGGRCVYDPEAVATETIPERIVDESRRRIRIGMGNYQALKRFAALLNPRRGALAFTFFSHKCMRWLVPHFLVLAFLSNLLAAGSEAYAALLMIQVAFYASAWVGWWFSRRGVTPRLLRLPFFFVSMNLSLLIGFWRYVTTGASGVWSRSAR